MSNEKRLLDEEKDKNKHLMNIVREGKRCAGYVKDKLEGRKIYCNENNFNWTQNNQQLLDAVDEFLRIAEMERTEFLQEQVDKFNNQTQVHQFH